MEKKKSKNVLLVVMGVLILAMVVVTICTIPNNVFTGVCRLICLLCVALYGFWLYKVPHTNMLKYAMLLVAATEIINSAVYLSQGKMFAMLIIRLFAAAAIVYCAGRLNRIEQNRIILPVIDAVALIIAIVLALIYFPSTGFLFALRFFGPFIILITLTIAYFVRYEEHRAAGLSDEAKE